MVPLFALTLATCQFAMSLAIDGGYGLYGPSYGSRLRPYKGYTRFEEFDEYGHRIGPYKGYRDFDPYKGYSDFGPPIVPYKGLHGLGLGGRVGPYKGYGDFGLHAPAIISPYKGYGPYSESGLGLGHGIGPSYKSSLGVVPHIEPDYGYGVEPGLKGVFSGLYGFSGLKPGYYEGIFYEDFDPHKDPHPQVRYFGTANWGLKSGLATPPAVYKGLLYGGRGYGVG